ncbi:diphthine--ammonia ligase [Candidatus Woesearchaeota archaeon]|nr:diphthine--ammonia ligase [Candidatus Woesearchaeota archaeon]
MDVAILYSGGKDSTLAIEHALRKKWNIKYLLSVKPNRTDCFLFHFATVEFTKELSEVLGLKHIYTTCEVADPVKEAEIVKEIVAKNPVDAVLLGGIGLQETQIRSIRDALFPLGIEVFATHTGLDEEDLLKEMISKGYEIVMTEIAADGLDESWLGKKIDKDTINDLKKLSIKYGFNLLGEGGSYNSLVIDGPIFSKKLDILDSEKIMEGKNSGYLLVKKIKLLAKLYQR